MSSAGHILVLRTRSRSTKALHPDQLLQLAAGLARPRPTRSTWSTLPAAVAPIPFLLLKRTLGAGGVGRNARARSARVATPNAAHD